MISCYIALCVLYINQATLNKMLVLNKPDPLSYINQATLNKMLVLPKPDPLSYVNQATLNKILVLHKPDPLSYVYQATLNKMLALPKTRPFVIKPSLKGNFAIFYMLAKYVPGDIKYIFTKFIDIFPQITKQIANL